MRLFKLGDEDFTLRTEDGQAAGLVGLFVDGANGVIYALTPEQVERRDPLWREDAEPDDEESSDSA